MKAHICGPLIVSQNKDNSLDLVELWKDLGKYKVKEERQKTDAERENRKWK